VEITEWKQVGVDRRKHVRKQGGRKPKEETIAENDM